MNESQQRGRDSWGWTHSLNIATDFPIPHVNLRETHPIGWEDPKPLPVSTAFIGVGCLRGEPTTEYVASKTTADIQPFISPSGRWVFTHNGTIANDGKIWFTEDTPATLGRLRPTKIDSYVIGVVLDKYGFDEGIRRLEGAFAILAYEHDVPHRMYYACNYKPLYALADRGYGLLFGSQTEYFTDMYNPLRDPAPFRLGPYAIGHFDYRYEIEAWVHYTQSLYTRKPNTILKSLVVCSGGLDSSTVAALHKQQGYDVTLLHVRYGCKAEGPEVEAVTKLAAALNCGLKILTTDFFTSSAGSSLTDESIAINTAGAGESGAELATEWVPARNLVLMSLAIAYAEKHGYDVIGLGTNQEESSAFPDNEMEFVNRLRDLLPCAVAPYRNILIDDPLGGFMKHDIVTLGDELNLPWELTYSCYVGGLIHCGECGPCYNRRAAFAMTGINDPTEYAKGPTPP
jgi:7-cyano-7-deazaguanine synthase